MENKKTLHIFCEKEGGYSTKRLIQEAEKKEISVLKHSLSKLLVCENGFYDENNQKVSIDNSQNTKIWFLSNQSPDICVARLLRFHGLNPFPFNTEEPFFLMGKFFANCFVGSIGVGTPKTCYLKNVSNIEKCVEYVGGFPCVIKKCSGSKGAFVEKVDNKEGIVNFIKRSSFYREENFVIRNEFLLQEFLIDSAGTDFRIICFNDEVAGGMKRSSNTDDFRSNYSLGGSVEKIEVPEDLKEISLTIMKKGNLFFAGLDFIKSKGKWMCIEINTNASFEGFEKATNINVAGKIIDKLFQN